MIKESYSNMGSEIGVRSVDYGEDLFGNDLGFLSRDRSKYNIFRSPSAPPTIAGGEREVTEEDIRADPAYVNYYYTNVNMNPRLPPPLISKEDWRFAHRVNGTGGGPGLGGIGDRRKVNVSYDNHSNNNNGVNSLFSIQPAFSKEENGMKGGGEWNGVGLPGLGLGNRQKSVAENIQEDDMIQTTSSGVSSSVTYASALGGSLSWSTTPDPQLIGRAPSPRIPTASEGRVNSMDNRNDLVAALSGMTLSNDTQVSGHQRLLSLHGNRNHIKPKSHLDQNYYGLAERHSGPNSPSNFHSIGSPSSSIPNYSLSGHSINPALTSMMVGSGTFPPLYENAAASAIGVSPMDPRTLAGSRANIMAELQNLTRAENLSQVDPMYLHYIASTDHSYMDSLALQKAYLGMLSPQKIDCGYYGNSGYNVNSPYVGNSFLRVHSGMRNLGANWRSESGGFMEQSFGSSLIDEFKSNKSKSFELSEIAGHVVEFSADQYGSRFIQQKLETATSDEKNMVFDEIIPKALSLMTDVFGNYVIQKFFEHGTAPQVRELADKLTGNVLTLSLQMYGCRVIQKAIEVVDLDQQKKMVVELDGHIMRCVRDQNGNHVIQKCIECIPEDCIQFIISTFYDQVVTLSTHPYGCRVIQRVLEHCNDQTTQQIVMDEIMQSVCMLAQDQYGNYVVQHVLEHGKPHERSSIISKLTGKIVQMSHQKFASNVIEKCLAFGDAIERRTIVSEMLGSTDDNEPLQVMMKDQFANYVVQKVLETCDEQQLEVILARIKVHLNALKKYTYGKHIVARVEKLVAAGERRMSLQLQSSYPSPMA